MNYGIASHPVAMFSNSVAMFSDVGVSSSGVKLERSAAKLGADCSGRGRAVEADLGFNMAMVAMVATDQKSRRVSC